MQGVILYNKKMILLRLITKNENLCYNIEKYKIIINTKSW